MVDLPPDLAALRADPSRVTELSKADALAAYASANEQIAQLEAVKSALAVRLVMSQPTVEATRHSPYTLHEAAALVGKSAPWLRRKAKAGAVPCAKKVGRSWVFPRGDFDRFRDRRQVC